jgi:sugar phosphate isomerase/epimerase
VKLGVFARIFRRDSPDAVAAAVAAAGFDLIQLNLNSFGWPTVPDAATVDLTPVRAAFERHGITIWGLSATYNMTHPDPAHRDRSTEAAAAMLARAGELGVEAVTLCTGTRDPDDMWRAHPDNTSAAAWRDMRAAFDVLIPAAAAGGVRLGVEPESGNVVRDAPAARRLLDELGADARHVGIVFDPANLLTPATLDREREILTAAADLLGEAVICAHAKDVVESGYAAAGYGGLDYDLVARILRGLPRPVPLVIQDAAEDDIARVRTFLQAHTA